MSRESLTAHLQYFGELGVTGVSRDAAWTTREVTVSPAPVEPALDETRAAEAPHDINPIKEPTLSEERPVSVAPVESASSTVVARPLTEIRAEIGDCTRCKLHTLGRKQIVFGVGNPDADLMFVGEAPGADEDEQGEPFVGRAGQLLTKIIEAINLQRSDVYIANVLKCRPPNNRAPEPDEVVQCEPFLFQQIASVKPKVIVALGTHAAHALLKVETPISKLRGQVLNFRGAKLVPTFHPAYLLRSPDRKRDVWEDMKKVRALLAGDE